MKLKWKKKNLMKKKTSNKMNSELQTVLHLKKYFNKVHIVGDFVKCITEKPARLLMYNIYSSWLKSILAKTHKQLDVCLAINERKQGKKEVPFGFIKATSLRLQEIFAHEFTAGKMLVKKSELELNLVVPSQEIMQYFIQWQRYRKYWWSSITTTPSLFSIGDINYKDETADVNIVAKFPFCHQIVETISMNLREMVMKNVRFVGAIENASRLSCVTSLEGALFILLIDALQNINNEKYLRLHSTMTPYKFAFATESEDTKIKNDLVDLSKLLNRKLQTKEISTFLPDLSLKLEDQIQENLQIGVSYTAVLRDSVLKNGIFHLLNSSTMLKEQLHVADFENYAALISKK